MEQSGVKNPLHCRQEMLRCAQHEIIVVSFSYNDDYRKELAMTEYCYILTFNEYRLVKQIIQNRMFE